MSDYMLVRIAASIEAMANAQERIATAQEAQAVAALRMADMLGSAGTNAETITKTVGNFKTSVLGR